ncbi:helix-turn-helix domain-containing protein [candidate division KSB1 bacterium]|nr:helix-turn-helix domain-containing protein [candidate division KSB1 bacterium]
MEESLYDIVGRNLVRFRKDKNYSQMRVHELTGLAQETISRAETKTSLKPPTIPTLEKLAKAYDKSVVDFFIEGDENRIKEGSEDYHSDNSLAKITSLLHNNPEQKELILELLAHIIDKDDRVLPIIIKELLKLSPEKRLSLLSLLS